MSKSVDVKNDADKKREIKYRNRRISSLAFVLVVVLSAFLVFYGVLNIFSIMDYSVKNTQFFTVLAEVLDRNTKDILRLETDYHRYHGKIVDDFGKAYAGGVFKLNEQSNLNEQAEVFSSVTSRTRDLVWAFFMTTDGDIVLSNPIDNVGMNAVEEECFSKKQMEQLENGDIEYLEVDNQYMDTNPEYGKKIYVYCRRVPGKDDIYAVLAFAGSPIEQVRQDIDNIESWVLEASTGDEMDYYIVNLSDGKFRYGYADEEDISGHTVSEYDFAKSFLDDECEITVERNGDIYYCDSYDYGSVYYGENMRMIALVPLEKATYGNRTLCLWSVCILLCIIILILGYSAIMRMRLIGGKEEIEKIKISSRKADNGFIIKNLVKRVVPVGVLGIVIMFVATFYLETLFGMSDAFEEVVSVQERIERIVSENSETQKITDDYYDNRNRTQLELYAFIVQLHGARYLNYDVSNINTHCYSTVNSDNNRVVIKDDSGHQIYSVANCEPLRELIEDSVFTDISAFDENGRVIAASGESWSDSLPSDAQSDSYGFWKILNEETEGIITTPELNSKGEYIQHIACRMPYYTYYDEEDYLRYADYVDYAKQGRGEYTGPKITAHTGMFKVSLVRENMVELIRGLDQGYILSKTRLSNNGYLLGIRTEKEKDGNEVRKVIYSPNAKQIGKEASELGMSETVFDGGINTISVLNGERCLQCFRTIDDLCVATIVPMRDFYKKNARLSLIFTLFTLMVLSLVLLKIVYVKEMDVTEWKLESKDPLAMFGHVSERMKERGIKRGYTHPAHFFGELVKNCFLFIAGVLTLSLLFGELRHGSNSSFAYILSGRWERDVNIFSLTACALVLIVAIVIIEIVRVMLRMIFEPFSNRAHTIKAILIFFVSFGILVAAIFYCLYMIGVDASHLFTTGAIISAILGFGSKNVFDDILNGVFIAFEGAVHVDDYVVINDIRGKVTEIGVRTTKIEDEEQNLLIIANSELRSLINMSRKNTMMLINVPIPYDESIDKVKAVLARELIKLPSKIKSLKGAPTYEGVDNFGESSIDIRIQAYCDEADRLDCERQIKEAIIHIFNENDIEVPFNQLDVHMK